MKSAMHSIFKTFLLSVLIIAQVHFAYAQTASILPPAKTTFVDQNGKPLTSGTVEFFIPSTSTHKTTWQDAAETIPNQNPVVLDGAGRALILGSGSYRQLVKDRNGNIVWDQITSSVGSGGGGGGTQTGDGDLVGTIKPWAGMLAPNQYMFAYGEEVSRTTFSVLLTAMTSVQSIFCSSGSPTLTGFSDTTNFPIGAAVEVSCITAGFSTIVSKTPSTITLAVNAVISVNVDATVFPWGNGNHTTTFNLPDLRGYVVAGNNNMGGAASTVLNSTYFGSDPNSTGGVGGSPSSTLLTANLPSYTPTGTVASTSSSIVLKGDLFTVSPGPTSVDAPAGPTTLDITPTITSVFSGVAQGGTSTPFSLIQPTKTANYIIKVTPDQNSATASGVTSLGLMTGDIACGGGLLCTGNVISSLGTGSIAVGITTVTNGTSGSPATVISNSSGLVGELGIATANQYNCATSGVLVEPNVIFQAETVTPYSTTTIFDFCTFKSTAVTLTGNITTQTLANVVAGKAGTITFIQDGSGSHTTVWNSIFKFSGGVTPTLTTTAGAVDILTYSCRSATFCAASLLTDVK